MKSLIYILVFFLFGASAYAQRISQENVPAVVLNSFQLKFPNADDVQWNLKDGDYEVKCKVNDKENTVMMDYKGHILKHHQDLYFSEIPQSVLETIRSKVDFFDMRDADKIEEEGKTIYELDYRIRGKSRYFWIDDKGHLVKFRKELHDNEIPASIISFIKKEIGPFEDIDRAKYIEENGKKFYIIAGEIRDRDHVFLFNDKEKLLEHYQDLKDSEIPAAVMKTIRKSYKGYDIRDADLTYKGGEVIYTLRLRKSGKNIFVIFNSEGKVLYVK